MPWTESLRLALTSATPAFDKGQHPDASSQLADIVSLHSEQLLVSEHSVLVFMAFNARAGGLGLRRAWLV